MRAEAEAEAEAERFLSALFGHPGLAGLYFCLWTKQDKRSDYYPCANPAAIADAARVAELLGAAKDVYVGCCPYVEAGPENGRGSAEKAGALVALWADIDVKGPGHSAQNLPVSKEDAAAFLLSGSGPRPSFIVDSGGGLHAWWLLDRPHVFKDNADRAYAMAQSTVWGDRLTECAAKRYGWKVDKVSDLARVLRVPGTLNHKNAAGPAPVFLILTEETARKSANVQTI